MIVICVVLLTAVFGAAVARAQDQIQVKHTFNKTAQGEEPNYLVAYHIPGQPLTWGLYGTTEFGGTSPGCYGVACGVVFKLTPPPPGTIAAWTETVLYSFPGSGNGAIPSCCNNLVFDRSGAIYGTAVGDEGVISIDTIYKLTPPAAGQSDWTRTTLYTAAAQITGLTIDPLGALYGVAEGTVFRLAPPPNASGPWTYTALYSYSGAAGPFVLDSTGALYGTSDNGGTTNSGSVFKLSPPAATGGVWTFRLLYSFDPAFAPTFKSPLVRDRFGSLYGLTTDFYGRVGVGTDTVYRLDPPTAGGTAWTHTILHTFTGPDGSYPLNLLLQNGAILGLTRLGGAAGNGTVFKLTPPAAGHGAWTETSLINLRDSEGRILSKYLTADASGNVYIVIDNVVYKVYGKLPQ